MPCRTTVSDDSGFFQVCTFSSCDEGLTLTTEGTELAAGRLICAVPPRFGYIESAVVLHSKRKARVPPGSLGLVYFSDMVESGFDDVSSHVGDVACSGIVDERVHGWLFRWTIDSGLGRWYVDTSKKQIVVFSGHGSDCGGWAKCAKALMYA